MKSMILKKFLSSENGFSLLETTIVLGVMGILGTLALPLLSQYRERQALQITQEHQKRVIEALESYLLHHHLLPSPADPGETSDHFAAGSSNPNMLQKRGIVPYRTLGLPEKMAKDGYGHYMTYAVADDACQSEISNHKVPNFCGLYTRNRIEIQDQSKESVLKSSDYNSNNIAFVLISHGPQGLRGPYASPESVEKINNEAVYENNKIIFVTHPYSTHPDNSFRHHIQWGTQQEFGGLCKTEKINQTIEQASERLKGVLKPFQEFLAANPEFQTLTPSSHEIENRTVPQSGYNRVPEPGITVRHSPETPDLSAPPTNY